MALPPGDDHAAVGVRCPAWERASHLSAGRDEPAASTSGTSLAVGGRDAVGATACTAVPAAASTAAGAVPATALAERAGGLRVRPAREQAVATRLLSPASTSAAPDTPPPAPHNASREPQGRRVWPRPDTDVRGAPSTCATVEHSGRTVGAAVDASGV